MTAPHRFPPAAPGSACAIALAALTLLLLAACSTPTSMDPIETDPGIAAVLRVVEAKTEVLFDELSRNAAGPFSEYDAIHYRPLLTEMGRARKLARDHERAARERRALEELEQSYERMRREHREGKLSTGSLRDFRTGFSDQIDALVRMEQR